MILQYDIYYDFMCECEMFIFDILKIGNKRREKEYLIGTILVSMILGIFLSNNINVLFSKKITSMCIIYKVD